MNRLRKNSLVSGFALFALLTIVTTVQSLGAKDAKPSENSYYLFTRHSIVDDSGVVKLPSRYQWSVETSWRGTDAQNKLLPDTRVMLRLYDPNRNSTAMTAQMDLDTAEKLHRELGDIIEKKKRDPDFQHRPELYAPEMIPKGHLKGVDENGTAIIELEYADGTTEIIPTRKAETPKRNLPK